PNDIVVLDNLGSHKGKAVRRAIRAVGAHLLFLPKYSPDLNPIEQVFAKLKGLVRKAAPRSLNAVADAIATALTAISLSNRVQTRPLFASNNDPPCRSEHALKTGSRQSG
ncbi:transposase, partial [Bradyrhizobium sp.]|uniref:transposase n=1 Tax=Bradyrhizobium sp. TaxID=376 RepID=UPI003C6FE75A